MEIDTMGAEPRSIVRDGRNYLWEGNPEYWGKHDPILFPTIGNCAEARIIVEGNSYPMPKHGFGQRMEWVVAAQTPDSVTMELRYNDETRKSFPFPFCVRQTWQIKDDANVAVSWEVTSDVDMPFMMGAHPAFAVPDFNADDEVHGYLQLDTPDIVSQIVLPDGQLHDEQTVVQLEEGNLLPMRNGTFACDTLLDIRGLNKKVTLLDKNRKPIVSVTHDMPVIALWSPKDGCCPFVCIEPWCGASDKPGYGGEFTDRCFMQHVKAGETWKREYTISIHDEL